MIGKTPSPPRLSFSELDAIIGTYFIETYNARPHNQTGVSPNAALFGDGWLPRMPDLLEDLDLLLFMANKSRIVRRDGIRFQGLRYIPVRTFSAPGHLVVLLGPNDRVARHHNPLQERRKPPNSASCVFKKLERLQRKQRGSQP